MTITIPQGFLAAHEEALNAWLATELGIDFNYYGNWVLPDMDPKGVAEIVKRSDAEVLSCTEQKFTANAVVRILIAGTDHKAVRRLLLDWGEHLELKINALARHGIDGTYRGVLLTRAFSGIKQIQGQFFGSVDNSQRQDLPEGILLGEVRTQYQFVCDRTNYDY